ncbi:hypothetical protein O3P69_011879 [Scylla paramamosain]|uniref:Uncharacterized protein n=1 Tax=Scylla paramamosain TaxID=85552 RepID=A0AAW0SCJ0_SCYPA
MAAPAAAAAPVDYSRLKLLCILEGPGAAVLSYALKCGTNKTASVTLLQYLTNLPDTSTANYRALKGEQKRKAFTPTEKITIADDPSCQSFDITLLHKCIRLACENVAGLNDAARWQDNTVMEGLLTKIKAERNECVHERPQMTNEQHFLDKVEELKNLFIRALQAVKERYGASDVETTNSSLYTNIHEWCTEKLHHRISVDPTWGKKRPQTRNTRIKRVLKVMYQMALQGLLQDRLSLSDEDIERLADCCEREDLPTHQVLGAFFILRSSVTNRVIKRKYYIPHKGLLEYFAAQHIMQSLQDGSLSESGAIRSLLHYVLQPQTKPLDLKGLRNLFWHVAGLLSTPGAPKRPEAIKEILDLLAETGAEWDEWISLVEDTHYNENFLQGIAHHVTENPPLGTVKIIDTTLASSAALLPHIPPRNVELKLENETVNLKNIHALTGHNCSALYLSHHFNYPCQKPASDAVLRALDRSHLIRFLGHLSAGCLALLPQSLTKLYLALPTDQYAGSLLAALSGTVPSKLYFLYIHVPMEMVTPETLTSPLPDVHSVILILSDVNKSVINEACQVAAALQPRKRGYRAIRFPRGKMKTAEWRELLHHLAAAKVTVERIEISEGTIAKKEERELQGLAENLLRCRFWRHHKDDYFLP